MSILTDSRFADNSTGAVVANGEASEGEDLPGKAEPLNRFRSVSCCDGVFELERKDGPEEADTLGGHLVIVVKCLEQVGCGDCIAE